MRDTDEDWRSIGKRDPYFGVLTHDKFSRKNLTPAAMAEFWQTGNEEIAFVKATVERVFGNLVSRNALDFGCGVGRLTRAMKSIATRVTGVDVSEAMLSEARSHAIKGMIFYSDIPDERYDWINSFIVFQHILPERGYQLFAKLLSAADEFCTLSVHFTLFKDSHGINDHGLSSMRFAKWDGENVTPLLKKNSGNPMMMYDYDLDLLVAMLVDKGFERLFLHHTNHAGAHGAWIFGQR